MQLAEQVSIQSEGKGRWKYDRVHIPLTNEQIITKAHESLMVTKAQNQAVWLHNPTQLFLASLIPDKEPRFRWEFHCLLCDKPVSVRAGPTRLSLVRTCKQHRGMIPKPEKRLKPAKHLGKTERAVMKEANKLMFEMHTDRFIDLCIEHLSRPKGQRDTRRQVVQRAIKSLCRKGLFPAAVKYGKIRPV